MRQPAIIFDLDGTLVDSVYEHVMTWAEVLRTQGIVSSQWRIHRAIGMSGKLFLPKLLRDEGHRHSPSLVKKLEGLHSKRFNRVINEIADCNEWRRDTSTTTTSPHRRVTPMSGDHC
jgi:beta-phosphoglucomutase-like phosphatase (HAD superfamily)